MTTALETALRTTGEMDQLHRMALIEDLARTTWARVAAELGLSVEAGRAAYALSTNGDLRRAWQQMLALGFPASLSASFRVVTASSPAVGAIDALRTVRGGADETDPVAAEVATLAALEQPHLGMLTTQCGSGTKRL